MGVKVRTMGMKRASTTARAPYFSKNFCVRMRCSWRKEREANTVAKGVADRVARGGGNKEERGKEPKVEVALRGEESGSKKETVAGKEEAKKQATLGKDNRGNSQVSAPLHQRDYVKQLKHLWIVA